MTATAHTDPSPVETHDPGHGADLATGHKSRDRIYVITAAVLAAITLAETMTFLQPTFRLWDWGNGVGVTVFLVVLMIVKFVGVVSIFMHLKYDSKILSVCFYSGLLLAVSVYLAMSFAFRFWWADSHMVPVKLLK